MSQSDERLFFACYSLKALAKVLESVTLQESKATNQRIKTMTDQHIMRIISKENKAKILDIQSSVSKLMDARIQSAFILGYDQAVQEFKDRTISSKYKITYEDFSGDIENPDVIEQKPIYNAEFNQAKAIFNDLKKRKMLNVDMCIVDSSEEG